ncbi:MAG: hypothetical protein ACFFB3_14530, partial [Candidatus Hodarchaeota archaeon]
MPFPLFSEKMISENLHIQNVTALNNSYFGWGVKSGDILSFTVRAWLDDQDILHKIRYRGPLVVKVLVESTPYIPRYFENQANTSFSFFPQLQILGYFHGNLGSSALNLSVEYPELSIIASHSSFLSSQSVIYPGYLEYLAKLYRSGTVLRSEDTEYGAIYETKLEHGADYFRATDKAEIPNLSLFYTVMTEFSRQDGILRELQIELSIPLEPGMLQDLSLGPGIHKIEEHLEFLNKENSGYNHEGSSDIELLILLATFGIA